MDHTANWKPDPFGSHELRFFSTDGKPTLLVMDGGKRSYDKPPADQSELPLTTDQSEWVPSMLEQRFSPIPDPPAAPSVAPTATPDHALHAAPDEIGEAQGSIPAVGPPSGASESHPHVADPVPPQAEADPVPPPAEALRIPAVDRPQSPAGFNQPETMSRPLKIAHAVVCGVLALSLLGLAYVHLLHHASTEHSTRAASPTRTLAHATTTTEVVLPATLSPTADAAATALVSSWSTRNRSAALTVATSTAVGTLFSVAYTSGLALARGCSTSFSPIVCTFGPPGGASPTNPIYQIKVSQVEGGWYVSSVKIEN